MALDSDGVPTTSGRGMMVEILCEVLAGSAMANEVGAIRVVGRP
jgi:hypothetical protein